MAALDDQFLDQLGPRSLVLDQDFGGTVELLLLAHRALELRILEPSAEQTEEEEVFCFDTPGRAHREIAELGGFVGGVPALQKRSKRTGCSVSP